jgi:ADP-ribosyl-[dinitrogen reductase] hydrolase
MLGGGWLGLKPGAYTDDTAMMLCLARSIVAKGCFDPEDVAAQFLGWFHSGALGIGRTTWLALSEMERGASWQEAGRRAHEKLAGLSAGNGSIMRCAPIGLLHFKNRKRLIEDSIHSSLITHFDPKACWGAAALNLAISELVQGRRDGLISQLAGEVEHPEVKGAVAEVAGMRYDELRTSAYVLDTLQTSLWCFWNTASFEEAMVSAVNLGGDTDTNGAVTGALAGAYYGLSQIPQRWLEVLQDREEIMRLAEGIYELAQAS